jgi:hypothetical protein
VSRHDSLQLPQANSDSKSAAAVPLAVPGFVITVSRVSPCIGRSISKVRLRIPVRVVPVCVIAPSRPVRGVLIPVVTLRVTVRAIRRRPVTVARSALVNHVRPLIVRDDDDPAARWAISPPSLTHRGDRENCAEDQRTSRTLNHFR